MDNRQLTPLKAVSGALGGFVRFCCTWFSVPAVLLCGAVCLAVFLSSCAPCARLSRLCPAAESTNTVIHDSIHVTDTVYIRDTLREVKLLPGTATAAAPVIDTVRAETDYATATSYVDKGNINLIINNKESALALVTETERLRSLLRFYSQNTQNVVVKREKYVPKAVKGLAWTGAATILAALFWLIFALARRLR